MGYLGEQRDEIGSGLLNRASRDERAADCKERLSFARPTRCLPGALRLEASQTPGDDSDDQEEQKAQPLLRVGDRQGEPGLREQQVIEQHGYQRGPNGGPEAEAAGHDDDGEQVDRR